MASMLNPYQDMDRGQLEEEAARLRELRDFYKMSNADGSYQRVDGQLQMVLAKIQEKYGG